MKVVYATFEIKVITFLFQKNFAGDALCGSFGKIFYENMLFSYPDDVVWNCWPGPA